MFDFIKNVKSIRIATKSNEGILWLALLERQMFTLFNLEEKLAVILLREMLVGRYGGKAESFVAPYLHNPVFDEVEALYERMILPFYDRIYRRMQCR